MIPHSPLVQDCLLCFAWLPGHFVFSSEQEYSEITVWNNNDVGQVEEEKHNPITSFTDQRTSSKSNHQKYLDKDAMFMLVKGPRNFVW